MAAGPPSFSGKGPSKPVGGAAGPLAQTRDSFSAHRNRAMAPKVEEGEGSWLVSYADMMTLLLGFFIMLQSFSKVDASNFEKVKQEAIKVFGGEYEVPYEDMSKRIEEQIAEAKISDQVMFNQNDAGVEINFRGALFFDLGSAELRDEARELLSKIIPIVAEKSKDFGITIEGHTDDIPIKSDRFASNWELSSVRACSVLRLFEEMGFPRDRIKAAGFADTKPTFPNRDENGESLPENQAQNRRVVIKILRDVAP